MDADTDFHFIIGQFKARFSRSRNSARFDGHAHGADVGDDLFGDGLDFRQFSALFSFGTGDLMDENRTGYAAAARRIQAVPDGDVIIDDDIVGLDIFIGCHFDGHFKVHDITCIVLDDAEDAFIRRYGFDAFQDLVRCRRREDRPGHGAVEHARADVAGMSRFMAAAAAADQGDFAFFFVGPDDDGPIIEFAQLLRCRFDQALNHFLFNVVDIIDNFFHDNPFFLGYS